MMKPPELQRLDYDDDDFYGRRQTASDGVFVVLGAIAVAATLVLIAVAVARCVG